MFIEVCNEDPKYLAEQSSHYEGMSDADAVSRCSIYTMCWPYFRCL
jgi:hypothetical protein